MSLLEIHAIPQLWTVVGTRVTSEPFFFLLPAHSDLSLAIVDSLFGIMIEIFAKSFVRSPIQTWSYTSASISPRLELSSLPRPRRHRCSRATLGHAWCFLLVISHLSLEVSLFALTLTLSLALSLVWLEGKLSSYAGLKPGVVLRFGNH